VPAANRRRRMQCSGGQQQEDGRGELERNRLR